jgi:DNA-binding NarL/FixJ family response regulator
MALEGHGFTVCAEVGDAAGAVEAARREQPAVCLLDVHMPGGGIAAAEQISAELPGTAIVMLTVSTDEDDLFAALRAGASGYLLKDTDPARLPAALQGVLAGEAAIPRRLVGRIVEEFSERGRRRLRLLDRRGADLTNREWEILELLHRGLTTAVVAERLGVSQVTVRRHLSEVMRKLDVPDRKSALELFGRAAGIATRRRSPR